MRQVYRFALFSLLLLLGAALATAQQPSRKLIPITAAGERLLAKLDEMNVKERWLPRLKLGDNWKTGESSGKVSTGTHCSAFVAAFCLKENIYILRPPEHGEKFLANAQFAWLMRDPASIESKVKPDEARKWKRVNAVQAQVLANRGVIVVAVCRNPDPTKPGHIAMVRPSDRSETFILRRGPKVTQAGSNNGDFDLTRGFGNHIPKEGKENPGPWIAKNVVFFAYEAGL